MSATATYAAAGLGFLIAVVAALWLSKKRGVVKAPYKNREFTEVLGRSALIEYTPINRYENATIAAVKSYILTERTVVLVTQAPRARLYYDKFKGYVEKGSLKVVSLTTENPLARPQMFRVDIPRSKEETREPGGQPIFPVSVNNLELLTEIVNETEEGSALIFEALTGLILALGRSKKESVYKFFSTIVEETSAKQRVLIALLNSGAHESEIVSAYEGLFLKILKMENDSIISLKGQRIKIPVEGLG